MGQHTADVLFFMLHKAKITFNKRKVGHKK